MQKLLIIIFVSMVSCSTDNKVYLCNGPQSKAYHKTSQCEGLKKCSTAIEAVDMATAKERHRKACGYCY